MSSTAALQHRDDSTQAITRKTHYRLTTIHTDVWLLKQLWTFFVIQMQSDSFYTVVVLCNCYAGLICILLQSRRKVAQMWISRTTSVWENKVSLLLSIFSSYVTFSVKFSLLVRTFNSSGVTAKWKAFFSSTYSAKALWLVRNGHVYLHAVHFPVFNSPFWLLISYTLLYLLSYNNDYNFLSLQ